ncbi:MAG: alpha/beta fold hydrolase [Chloroflexota bacterium]|nr:MAG: alpha/beta fold hydrolase [Chloroflexota bacterium]
MIEWFRTHPKLSIFLGILGGFIILLLIMANKPFSLRQAFTPEPAEKYEEALVRIEAVQAAEAEIPDLSPECGSILMTHEEKVANVIVFLHGFTSCPDQFAALGEEYFNRGYNVFIPRQPRHGLQEFDGSPLKGLNAEELAAFGNQIADISQGLGERVVVVGLSGGGAVTTWLAQERDDIDLAVPIAPFLGIGFIPRPLTRPLTNLILLIPDFHQWWDPVHQLSNPLSASYSYRGYQMHALFENLRLGFVAEEDAKKVKPATGGILVITNANDESVNNEVVAEFEQLWLEHGEQFLQTFQFEKELEIPHDMITVSRPNGRVDIVYPKLLELIQ